MNKKDINEYIELLAEDIINPYFKEVDTLLDKNISIKNNLMKSLNENMIVSTSSVSGGNSSNSVSSIETPIKRPSKKSGKEKGIELIGKFKNKLKDTNDIKNEQIKHCSECYKLESTDRKECIETFMNIMETSLSYMDKNNLNKEELKKTLYNVSKITVMKELVKELFDK